VEGLSSANSFPLHARAEKNLPATALPLSLYYINVSEYIFRTLKRDKKAEKRRKKKKKIGDYYVI